MNSAVGFDWAKRFSLHAAAALIAGVPVCSKKEPDMEEIHAEARPVLVAMLTAWATGMNYQKGQPMAPDYPVAQTLSVEELGCEKPVAILVRRAELHRWIAAMGLPSVYDFSEPALKADRISVAAELLKPDNGPAEPVAEPAPQAGPVWQAGPDEDLTQDSERRLARLRELGGSAKYKNSDWKFTGISALVEREKSEGRKRSDEKTIRADLKEAAQDELDARRAGAFTGLGAR